MASRHKVVNVDGGGNLLNEFWVHLSEGLQMVTEGRVKQKRARRHPKDYASKSEGDWFRFLRVEILGP